jgi:hypothetical protein
VRHGLSPRRRIRIVAGSSAALRALSLALSLVACTPLPANCPNDLPMSCPSPTPSYANDVAPIISRRCLQCHSAGGQEAVRPLDSYAGVTAQSDLLDMVYSCRMPPPGEPAPTTAERTTLLGWLVCGEPRN